jgi:D-serine deaminase-like pyridoxal phosphate-dependent protein
MNAITTLATPFVAVDLRRLDRNITRMQDRANRAGVALRPHVKTHKCLEIALRQLAAGAIGITASKPSEAAVFARAGLDVLLAYPIVDHERLKPVLEHTERRISVVADSIEGVHALNAAGATARSPLDLLIEIDVGLRRCGVRADSNALSEIAKYASRSPHLILRGVMSHAGHAYGGPDKAAIQAVAEAEGKLMAHAAERIEPFVEGIPRISIGSTPSVLAVEDFGPAHEIRPGNYVFLDLTAMRLGLARREEIALSVVSTIVSMNDDYFIIDAGSKTLSSDMGAHGIGGDLGYGLATALDDMEECAPVVALSEEHGRVARNGLTWSVGERVRILPNHSCPVVNLTDRLVILEAETVLDSWPVAARGRVH